MTSTACRGEEVVKEAVGTNIHQSEKNNFVPYQCEVISQEIVLWFQSLLQLTLTQS